MSESASPDIPGIISEYFYVISLTMFFTPIFPLAIPIAFVGSILIYLLYQLSIVRRFKRPEILSR